MTRLRHRQFFSVVELNAAVVDLLPSPGSRPLRPLALADLYVSNPPVS
jgi:hypothetical protein